MRRWFVPAVGVLALLASLSCAGGGGGAELLIVDQNILHGILDEDPEAEPFDRFPERIQLIADALAELEPDIIFLQEVLPGAADDPEYADVRAVLLDTLGPEYTAVFGDITGAPIDEGSLGQMTLTKLPVVSSENHFIGGVRAVHRVTVETDDGPVDVYNAHLEGSGAVTDAGEEEAVIEIENVLGFIEESRTEGAPVILAGDLNAEPDESSIRRLLDAGFVDALTEAGDPTCEQAGDPGCTSGTVPLGDNADNLTDHRIDYIFVMSGEDRAADIKEAALFLNEPVDIGGGRLLWASDHIGVRATLELE